MVTTLAATSTCATPGSWNSRSTSGDPAACSRFSKKSGPPGWTVRLTVNLHVSGSASETSARMMTGGSTGRASDIFDNLPCSALAQGTQVVERIDPGVMAVAPVDPDRIITDARDQARAHIGSHRLRIEQLPATHLLDAEGAMTRQAQVADIEVVAVAVLPEHGQRPSVAAANANRHGPRARRPDDALQPARLSLIAVPPPHKGLQHGRRSGVELFPERGGNGGVRLRGDRLLLVDGAGRKVENQVVEMSPLHTADQHAQVLTHHRPAQHCRCVVTGEHAH